MPPQFSPPKLLISNVDLITNGDTPMVPNQWLLCEGEQIHSFGPMEEMGTIQAAQHIDAAGKLLMPGLINGHAHSAMTLFRGFADDLPLQQWLNDYIFPAESANVSPEMVYWCTKLAAMEMILSGTTTVADGYFYEEQTARALLDTGMRCVPAQGIIDFPAPGVPDPKKNIAHAEIFLQNWTNTKSRIRPALFAHSPYTCSPQTLQRAKDLANQYNTSFFIHAAETKAEQQHLMEPHGDSPIQHLDALGILDSSTILIHCVWLSDADREIISKNNSGIIICPHSHAKLASGMAEVDKMIEQNIRIGLGTDSCASNNHLDMFLEMDLLAKGQKLRTLDATTLSAQQALAAATNGDILGIKNLGTIAKGHKADFILLDMQNPHLTPCYSHDFLTYNANGADVDTVVIDGEIILQSRKFTKLDVQECVSNVRRLAQSLYAI